ncbi:MAG: carboxypeptidase-like regulatory domain-containing protein [Bacteroidales bacterium]|nr:carboxypeptidase-like regulatory domain-containing protein [Bacteroidales bacterium]
MNPGKVTCEELKKIRKMIADKNNIPYEITECKFSGRCSGTCPFCESEVKYLETQLAKRKSLGKKVLVTGIAVGLCVFAQAQDIQQIDTVETVKKEASNTIKQMTVKGIVLDENKDPLPGVTVIEEGTTNGTITDLDGKFNISVTHDKIQFSDIGYKTSTLEVSENMKVVMEDEELTMEEGIIVIGYDREIIIDFLVRGEIVDECGFSIDNVTISEIGCFNKNYSDSEFEFQMENKIHELEFSAPNYETVIMKPTNKMRVVMKRKLF